MATAKTLAIRERARLAARPTVEAPGRGAVSATLHRPNPNRGHYCEACALYFPETEALEGPGGWSLCPTCGQEVA